MERISDDDWRAELDREAERERYADWDGPPRSKLRYDSGHPFECGSRCLQCAEEDNPEADPCENCGEDMTESGRVKTDLGFYCPDCYQREYDREAERASEEARNATE